MSKDDELNDHLERAFRERRSREQLPSVAHNEPELITQRENPEVAQSTAVEQAKMGALTRLRARNAASAHELQKARLTYETEIGLLRHKADAALRESRAFWDARSVEIAETIKTYVQSTIRALEIDRLDSRNSDLQRAYESASAALTKAKESSLPQIMQDRLIQDILTSFENTVDRIQSDTIVSKYDLD